MVRITRVRWLLSALLAVASAGLGLVASPSSAGAQVNSGPSVTVEEFSPNAPFASGLTSDPAGNLYVASCFSGLFEIPANDPAHNAIPISTNASIMCPMHVTYYAGSLYVSDLSTDAVWRMMPDGSSASIYFAPTPTFAPSQVAFGPDGTMYVGDMYSGSVLAVAPGGTGSRPVTSVAPACPWGMGYRGGSLVMSEVCAMPIVQSVSSTGGVATTLFSPFTFLPPLVARGDIAVDPAGNAFLVAAGYGCAPGSGGIVEIPAGSSTPVRVNTTGLALSICDVLSGITWSNGYIYFENGGNVGDIARFADPVSLNSAPRNLTVTRDWTTLTGTWNAVPGALGYTCTLLYGLGLPSSFTTITSSPSCSFYGLTPSTNYGVQVVAKFPSGVSSPVGAFPVQAPITITCVQARRHVHVTGWNPLCPAHYRRVH